MIMTSRGNQMVWTW